MRKRQIHLLFGFLLCFLALPALVHSISYYTVIEKELKYCEDKGGELVGIENGIIGENTGCPGCFCQFKDGSICVVEHLKKSCKKGQYKTFFDRKDLLNAAPLPDLVLYGVRSGGYTYSKPGDNPFYVVDTQTELGRKIDRASGIDLPGFFKTGWAEKDQRAYHFTGFTVCNGSVEHIFKGDVSLRYNGSEIKGWSGVHLESGECHPKRVYSFLDMKTSIERHHFELVTNSEEMTKTNNTRTYLKRDNYFEAVERGADVGLREYYVSMDGEHVFVDELGSVTLPQETLFSFLRNMLSKITSFFLG